MMLLSDQNDPFVRPNLSFTIFDSLFILFFNIVRLKLTVIQAVSMLNFMLNFLITL